MNKYCYGWTIFILTVPVSFVFQCTQKLRNFIFRVFFSRPHYHNKRVEEIQRRVASAYKNKKKMCTARKPWKAMSLRIATYKSQCEQIPVNLKNILSLAVDKKIIRVEPMVTMSDLTHFLVPKGYALAVHVEMDDLTVGGLCMGAGIETTSHRFGFLFETVHAFEIVIADGSLLRVTRTEYADLFYALPWSHGTLGFLVAVELQVVAIKPYMRLEYIPCLSQEAFCTKLQQLADSENAPPYIEGLVFSSTQSVIMCGRPADLSEREKEEPINRINRWYKKWFYTHVETSLASGSRIEFIPMKHYFHRHTPSVFFQLRELIPFANSLWYRYLLAWLGAPKVSLMKFTYTKELRRQAMYHRVTQDIIVPLSDLNESLDFCHPRFGIYPLWVCPVRLFKQQPHEGFLRNPEGEAEAGSSRLFVDIGIYGLPKAIQEKTPWDMIAESRQLEAFTMEKKGYHLLYADIFMTKQEFETMFNHTHYRAMRKKYRAENAFPEVYDKVIPEFWLYRAN